MFTWSKEAVEKAVKVPLKNTDCIIASFPKTGQTWTLQMISLILKSEAIGRGEDIQYFDNFQGIPFIETEWPNGVFGADFFRKMDNPRFMKTHLPFHLWEEIKACPNVKVIQNIRDPKDALVSSYHHTRSDTHLGAFNGNWDQFFEQYRQKRLAWGDFFEFTSEWYKFNKDRKESLVLFYEEMKKDPRGHLIKIAEFLGYELSEKVIDTILEMSSHKVMAEKINGMFAEAPAWKSDRSQFIRKGETGGWAEVFSEEQREYVDAKCKEYLEPLRLKY